MTEFKKIRKAILPVAGLGTRFLPATKAVPKEMLTVVDKPVVQYVVEEALDAGIEHIVFVTGRNKGVIEDHFDIAFELNDTLEKRGKTAEFKQLEEMLPAAGKTSFTRQQAPHGLGHAVWCARDIVGETPFVTDHFHNLPLDFIELLRRQKHYCQQLLGLLKGKRCRYLERIVESTVRLFGLAILHLPA